MKKKDPEQHVAILRETHVERLARENRLPKAAIPRPERKEQPAKLPSFNIEHKLTRHKTKQEEAMKRRRLNVLYDAVPPFPPEHEPPCGTCKAVPCCVATVIPLTKEEFESGNFGEYAVKLTKEVRKQLRSGIVGRFLTALIPGYEKEGDLHVLDSAVGDPCPFLRDDNKCSIYEKRPLACRMYTCVTDPNIDQEVRDGTKTVFDKIMENK